MHFFPDYYTLPVLANDNLVDYKVHNQIHFLSPFPLRFILILVLLSNVLKFKVFSSFLSYSIMKRLSRKFLRQKSGKNAERNTFGAFKTKIKKLCIFSLITIPCRCWPMITSLIIKSIIRFSMILSWTKTF